MTFFKPEFQERFGKASEGERGRRMTLKDVQLWDYRCVPFEISPIYTGEFV